MKLPQFRKLFILLCFLQLKSIAQEISVKYLKMEALTINNGLSQGMINSIYQDHFGFMWFGTMDGLNRYDGYHFMVYNYDAEDINSISGNLITAIFEDSKGRLWVGTALNGLNLFDRETEHFTRFQHDHANTNSISDNKILSIREDLFGNIWVGTTHGLNKIIIQKKAEADAKQNIINQNFNTKYKTIIKRIHLDTADSTRELFAYYDDTGNSDYFEPSLFIDHKGVVWVSTINGIYSIKPSSALNDSVKKWDMNAINAKTDQSYNRQSAIYNFAEDSTRKVLFLMRKNYITMIDEKSGSINNFYCGKINPAVSRGQIVINSGIIWESSNGSLYQYVVLQNKIWNVRPKNKEQENMLNYSNTVYQDRTGTIWIGTKGYGILKYNPRTEKFHAVNVPSIIWMSATPDNNIIVQSKKILLYEPNNLNTEYLLHENYFKKVYDEIPNRTPNLAVQNREGNYWINVSSLVQFNPANKTVTKIPGPYLGCFPLYVDVANELWFGSPTALCHHTKNTGTTKEYLYPFTQISMFPYKFLQAIYQDKAGIFWLGTVNGLLRFDETKEQWKRYANIQGDSASLSVDVIFSICEDIKYPQHYLWIGTNGGGLNCFDKQAGKFIRFNKKNGLPNKVVYGILNDDDGNLWMSTNMGLSRFTPHFKQTIKNDFQIIDGGTFKNFEEADGLQSNEFNRNAFARTKSGMLFFGGVNGFNYFDPKEINSSNIIPDVVLTDFKINNKSVSFSQNKIADQITNSPLSKPVFLTDKITLSYSDNMISFEFSAMNFTAAEKNFFQYKLQGFDKEWIQSGINNLATYTNLDPGNYTFHVKAGNDTDTKHLGSSVILVVMPPWYMSWWFRTAIILFIGIVFYGFYRYRIKQALNLLEVRNRIASDLHDEIGSTLSSVYIYSEVAQKSMKEKLPDADLHLRQISVNVANMIESLGDIVWTVNAKNDRFENIINRMRASAIELFEARNYKLHLEFDDQLNTLKLGMEARKNFYLFYKEAINNIAKYAEGKNVWINLGFDKRNITLLINDDGKGFDANVKSSGNGLSNMKKRASDLNGKSDLQSVINTGTTVKLSFPYS